MSLDVAVGTVRAALRRRLRCEREQDHRGDCRPDHRSLPGGELVLLESVPPSGSEVSYAGNVCTTVRGSPGARTRFKGFDLSQTFWCRGLWGLDAELGRELILHYENLARHSAAR